MNSHPIFAFRDISNAYSMVLEAASKSNGYKFLTPEQAEAAAKLSPSYRSDSIWGMTSQWICSMVNRMIKFRKLTFEDAYKVAQSFKEDIDTFEKYKAKLKTDISAIRSFEELRNLIQSKKNELTMTGLSQTAKSDGRARQCYSLLKNGISGGDVVQVYEDGKYLIGYPTNLNYNKNFSSIGKWCHTGSFGDAESYWGKYAQYPIFYILNKENGDVLCASYQDGYGEVRDQMDNYPEGFTGSNWNDFFRQIGLKSPMVDNIGSICAKYEVPDDAFRDVWDRVDEYEINSNLFNNQGATLEGDDYGRGTGNFYLQDDTMKIIEPSTPEDEGLITRYSDSMGDDYYTFDEFREISKATWVKSGEIPSFLIDMVLSSERFKDLWDNATNMEITDFSYDHEIEDSLTMSDRFSPYILKLILLGENVNISSLRNVRTDNIERRLRFIKNTFINKFVKPFKSKFDENTRNAFFPNKETRYGDVDVYDGSINISIDADEAQSLSNKIENNEFSFEKGPDILALNLGGKNSFAVKRVDLSTYDNIETFIGYVKYFCKTPIDAEGQMTFDLRWSENPTEKYYTTNSFITPDIQSGWRYRN